MPIIERRILSERNHIDFKLSLEEQKAGIDFLKDTQNGPYALPVKVAQMKGDSIIEKMGLQLKTTTLLLLKSAWCKVCS